MRKVITPEFQADAEALSALGKNKSQIARILGVCQRTVRRAFAAMAQAGSAHCVYPIDPRELEERVSTRLAAKYQGHSRKSEDMFGRRLRREDQDTEARNREAGNAFAEALARESGLALG